VTIRGLISKLMSSTRVNDRVLGQALEILFDDIQLAISRLEDCRADGTARILQDRLDGLKRHVSANYKHRDE
jgi:coenzyme F420-reducing hydrogenase delta subunit